MLRWATLNGAQALGHDSTLGTIEVGKQPGLVWIENVAFLPTVHLTADSKAQRIL